MLRIARLLDEEPDASDKPQEARPVRWHKAAVIYSVGIPGLGAASIMTSVGEKPSPAHLANRRERFDRRVSGRD